MKKLLLFLTLLIAAPAFGQPSYFIPAERAQRVTSPSGTSCSATAYQPHTAGGYYYIPCQDADTWSGDDEFEWKFVDNVPGWLFTSSVHFQVVYETNTTGTGGAQQVEFHIGAIVHSSTCDSETGRTVCKSLDSVSPTLSYAALGTNSITASKCVGHTDPNEGGVTADGATCTSDTSCTGDGQICTSKVQYTDLDGTPYVLQTAHATADSLVNCNPFTCSSGRVTYTVVRYNDGTSLQRDLRILGLLVIFNQS